METPLVQNMRARIHQLEQELNTTQELIEQQRQRVMFWQSEVEYLRNAVAEARNKRVDYLMGFVKLILHGDEEHRKWLLDAADRYLQGHPVYPPPTTTNS